MKSWKWIYIYITRIEKDNM